MDLPIENGDFHPPPLKMYEEGGVPGNFHISRAPPPLKRVFLYELVFVKLRDYLKRWGVLIFHSYVSLPEGIIP